MIVIPKEEAYESVRNRVWYPPACENKEEHINFLFKGCQEIDIVFCKDCKWQKFIDWGMGDCLHPKGSKHIAYDNHYCSYGERRDL